MKRSALRKVSKKRSKQNREYMKLRKAFLTAKPYCEVFEPCCTRKAVHIHHMNHREGKRLLDHEWWLACCSACHRFLHDHPSYARQAGFLI